MVAAVLARSRFVASLPRSYIQTFTRTYTATAPKKAAKNRLYNPVRYEDEFETLNLLSASSRVPLITLWSASWCPSQEAQLETKAHKVEDMKNRQFLISWIETEAKRHGEGGAGGSSLFGLFGR
ncbi:unnamed protein product, partial [Aureobasidium pullulans]